MSSVPQRPYPKDHIVRSQIRATIVCHTTAKTSDWAVTRALPQGWSLADGVLCFDAGEKEELIMSDLDYSDDGKRSLEEQKALAKRDLMSKGFSAPEADEFLASLPVRDYGVDALSLESSAIWLKQHPEYRERALGILDKAIEQSNMELVKSVKDRGGRLR